MMIDFDTVYSKGIEVGWSGLSYQEHAVLLYHNVNERVLEEERKKEFSHV
jgi:hypothetical protein